MKLNINLNLNLRLEPQLKEITVLFLREIDVKDEYDITNNTV